VSWIAPVILFLLYLNVPAVAVRMHGAPFILGAIVPLALGVPVAHRVIVRGEPIRLPKLLVAATVMLGLHAVSAIFSAQPSASIDSLETWVLEGVILALLVANAIRTREELLAAVLAIVAAGAVMGAIAVVQQLLGATDNDMFGFGQLDAAVSGTDGEIRRRLAGPIGETNRFAQIMAVLIPLAAGCAATSRSAARWLWWAATGLIGAGMLFAYSRGAIVALGLALPFALLFRFVRLRHVVASLALAVAVLAVMPTYAQRVVSIGEVAVQALGLSPVGLRNADGASRGRMTEMKAAGILFIEHPILGAGPGLAPRYYNQYATLVGGKVRPDDRRAHNLFVQLAAETGVIGLGAFLVVLGLAFRDLDRARRRLETTDRRLWGMVCGLELALIISLTTSLFLHAAYIRYFWLLLGLTAAATAQARPPVLFTLLERMLRETAERIRADA
jgi:O-antigen ligase